MKVLVACEFSGRVRDAFIRKGHHAWSIDLLPGEGEFPEYHIQEDVLNVLNWGWDLMIAHPPCTYLAVCGNKHYSNRWDLIGTAATFVQKLANAQIEKIAIENPVGRLSTIWRKPDQYIQPWMFGHGETKKTGLWLKNLPKLIPTNIVEGREERIWKMAPAPDRAKRRSITYQGIAEAMASQWSSLS